MPHTRAANVEITQRKKIATVNNYHCKKNSHKKENEDRESPDKLTWLSVGNNPDWPSPAYPRRRLQFPPRDVPSAGAAAAAVRAEAGVCTAPTRALASAPCMRQA